MDTLAYSMWTAICAGFSLSIGQEAKIGQPLSIGQKAVGDSACNSSGPCFTLYKASTGCTRTQANVYCRVIGGSLAVIPDEDTQNAISRLAGRGTGTDQLAWIGGLRGRGTRWKDADGGFLAIAGRVFDSNDSGSWCSGVKISTFPGDFKVFPLECTSTNPYRGVCEISTICRTDTSIGQFDISDVCHEVSDVMFTSWVEAQDHCERTHTGGNLASSVIDRGSHFSQAYNNSEVYFWTGIQRRSWVWKSSTETLVTYTNWLPSEPGASDTGECLVVDLTQNGGWRVSDCDVTRDYFICEGPPVTTLTTAERTSTTTTKTTTPGASTEWTKSPGTNPSIILNSTTSASGCHTTDCSTETTVMTSSTVTRATLSAGLLKPPILYYIIGGCAAGFILIIIIIIAVVCTKRRAKRRQSVRNQLNINYAVGPSIGLNGQTSHGMKTADEKPTNKSSTSGAGKDTELSIDAKPVKRSEKIIMENAAEDDDDMSSIRSGDGQKDEVEKFTVLPEKPSPTVGTLQKGQNAEHGSSTSMSNPTYGPCTTGKAPDESPYDIAEVVDAQKLAKSLDSDGQVTKAEELISTGGASRQEPLYDDAAEVRMRDTGRSSSGRNSDLEIVDNALYVPA